MKRLSNRWWIVLAVLVIASLACSALGLGGSPTSAPSGGATGGGQTEAAPPPAQPPSGGGGGPQNQWPTPKDVKNLTDLGDGQINFQTSLSLKDTIAFYREAFTKMGLKERTLNTAITDSTFSMVFDGHAGGKAVVIQGVDLGGSTNVNIRLEDV